MQWRWPSSDKQGFESCKSMTTTEEHNKYLAYSHLGYAAFQLLMMLLMVFFSFIIFAALAADDAKGDFPTGLIAAIMIVGAIFQLIFAAPSAIAGFGLLKRKQWAKTWSIIAGVTAAMSFPLGTAVCVYTFWFLFSDAGKDFHSRLLTEGVSRPDYYLHEQQDKNYASRWTTGQRAEYVPPKEMPNWRD
jgi:hypothetical protein